MKLKLRNIVQTAITLTVVIICINYFLYINDFINFKILSMGDMNPYGGWSALKSAFTDISYKWRGLNKSIALTIAITVTALLMGRFFCGYICPIGALQDFFKYIGEKLGIKEVHLYRGKYFKPEIIKYFVFILVTILSILGIGKIISMYSPWVAYLNIFMGFNILRGTFVLVLIIVSSMFIKRIFCRCFCPLGALQGLIYAVGPLKINKNKQCNGCNKCLVNCPVDIENTEDSVMSPECINCLECTENVCINGGEGYSIKFASKKIRNKQYVSISIVIFFVIYIFLPMVTSNSDVKISESISNIKNGTFIGEGIGFGGKIEVQIYVYDNKINKINVEKHNETSGYYEEVFKNISREIVEEQNINIDSVSGATASSRGMKNAVKDALSKAIVSNK